MKRPGIPIHLGDKEAPGVYANLALITHSSSEFVIDFAKMLPGLKRATVQSRVIMTPQHVKLLAKALDENLKKYEDKYGSVRLPDKNEQPKGIGFRSPEAEESGPGEE